MFFNTIFIFTALNIQEYIPIKYSLILFILLTILSFVFMYLCFNFELFIPILLGGF